MNKKDKAVKVLRIFRKIHRVTGIILFLFFMFIAVTGLLLGWKKHTGGLILPETKKGVSKELSGWLPLDSLEKNSIKYFREKISGTESVKIDRLDIRPDKGIVKVVFADNYWEIQADGVTGEVLSAELRWSDFIENLHDASYLDKVFGVSDGYIKLIYTSVMGGALLIFTVTGFWLWAGPKRLRKLKKEKE
ncbi:MAG: PepSY domain-containing protein [Ignavibacteria bacterium]|nr:PepSY domain-containing protein [Ignavibacteria bacterium]HCN37895.1 DNA mismatch repair protein [Bacteroidota bacterium]